MSRLRRLVPRRSNAKRTAGVVGLTAATLAVSVLAFVPAGAQEVSQNPPADPVEEPQAPPQKPPADAPADPPSTPEPAPAPGPVVTPPTGDAAVATELPAVADPAGDYRLNFRECAYDAIADETTCTWQLTDSFGNVSAPGGVTHVALDTCLGPDATPLPADDDLILGALRWDVSYDAPDLALDPNQPPVNGWTWDLSEGQIPVGAELSLVKAGEIPGTGSSSYVLQNDDEYRSSDAGPLCPSVVQRLGALAGPSTLAAPGDAQTVTIRKQTTPGGDPQLFNFVLQKCNLGSTSSCNSNPANWVTVANGSQNLADDGVFTWGNDNTAPGTLTYDDVRYRVLETTPAGWTFVNLTSCTTGLENFSLVNSGNQHGASFRFQNQNGDRFLDCTWNNAVAGQATIRIFKGGDRTGVGGSVGTLNGATFNVYDNAGLVGPPVGSCTTGPVSFPAGQCDVEVDADQAYWVAEASSPSPFNTIPELTISSGGTQNYSIAIPASQVEEGETAFAPPNQSGYQRRFANRRDNAAFPTTCGISIAMLIDNSNSINSGELTQMKDAALAFSNGLAGTGSPIGVYRFGSTAATLQTPTTNTANVNTAINAINTGGGATNWDDAFQEVSGSAVDIVIIMTDGNPTISNVGGSGSTTTFWDIEEGVASANMVKSQGPKVLALGIGGDVSPLNLQAISGPIEGPVDGNYDYTIASFEEVEDDLVAIATQLCGAQINVTKLVDGQPAADWVFTPTAVPNSIAFNPSPTGTTDGNGEVTFSANPVPADGGTVTLTESLAGHPGINFVNATCENQDGPIGNQGVNAITFPVERQDVIDCVFNNSTNTAQFTVNKDFSDDNPANVSVTLECASGTVSPPGAQNVSEAAPFVWTVSGFTGNPNCTATEDPIPAGYDSTGTCSAALQAGECTIVNTLSQDTFTVNKDFSDDNPANVSVTLECASGTVSPPGAQNVSEAAPFVWTVSGFTGNPNCTATEDPIPAGYDSTGTCSAALQAGECTIVNTLSQDTFTVNKDFSDDNPANVSVTLECASGTVSPPGAQNVSEAAPFVWTVSGFTGNPNCTATEDPIPAGYDSTGTCSAALQAGSCTITNTLNTADVTVVKLVDGQPTADWTFGAQTQAPTTVTPPSGETNAQGELDFDLTQVLNTGSNLTITETLQPGYSFQGATCQTSDQQNVPINFQGLAGTLAVNPGEDITCTFSNTLNTAEVTVIKLVDGQVASDWTFGTQTTPPTTVDPASGATDAQGEIDFDLTHVLAAGSPLTITETLQDGYSFDGATCVEGAEVNVPIDFEGLAGTLSVSPGDDITCTFNNSANTATINLYKIVDDIQTGGWTMNASVPGAGPARFTPGDTTNAQGQTDANNPLTFNLTKVSNDGTPVTIDEVLQAGYSFDNIECPASDHPPFSSDSRPGVVTVNDGDVWDCTFENLINEASLTVVKEVDGQPQADWTFGATSTDPTTIEPVSGVTDAQGEVDFTALFVLDAGSPVTITETLKNGYELVGASCVDSQQQEVPIDLEGLAGTLTINTGDDITCTFENAVLPASISITKTATPTPVNAGNDVTYTITAVNDGEVDLTNVMVTDPLALELTPVSATPSKGSCNLAQTITCDIGNLAVDEEVTIEVVATVAADTPGGTEIDNVASVTGDPPVGPPVGDEDDVTIDVSQPSPTTVVPPTTTPQPGPEPGPVPRVVSGTLPFTGSPTSMLLKAALWLLGIGALLVSAVQRRRRMAA